MDAKLDKIINELAGIRSELKSFMDETRRELGIRRGQELAIQIDRLEQHTKTNDDKLNQILRTVEHTMKLVEYNDVNVKEVMKALSYIYRDVDELEETLLPEKKT
jgi:hypothetical protein